MSADEIPQSMNALVERALANGAGFLRSVQKKDGSMPVYIGLSRDLSGELVYAECLFGTAFIASVLAGCPAAADVTDRACDFIEGQKLRGWLWNYHFRTHSALLPPPDVDDTALSLHALAGNGRKVPRNLKSFLANRDPGGRFYTWFEPLRAGRPRLRLLQGCWRQLLFPWRAAGYYRSGYSTAHDIDAGINANVVNWLGRYDGDEDLIDWLIQILRDGREGSCDKYYHDPMVVLYFLARALAYRNPEARDLLLARCNRASISQPAELAMAILLRRLCSVAAPDDMISSLIAAQAADGSWPIFAIYCAGRPEIAPGEFGAPVDGVPMFGSQAMTTALAMSALDAVRLAG